MYNMPMGETRRLQFMDAVLEYYNQGYSSFTLEARTFDFNNWNRICSHISQSTFEAEIVLDSFGYYRFWFTPAYAYIGQFIK